MLEPVCWKVRSFTAASCLPSALNSQAVAPPPLPQLVRSLLLLNSDVFFFQRPISEYSRLRRVGGIPAPERGINKNAAIWTFFSAGRSSLDVCARLAGEWNLYCGYGGCRQRDGVGRRVFVTAAGSDTSQDGENFIFPRAALCFV